MKVKSIPLLIIILFIFLFFIFYFKLLDRPIVENDEGIYWATFLLVNKGYKLYKEISFSQLPGFFLAVYPIFKLFGSTIAAARLGVFFWSLVALFSIIWLGYVRKTLLFSLVSVALLISIPTFFNRSITLQSDIIAAAFSTLSFVFLITFRFNQPKRLAWLLLSSLFFSLALLTKFDYSLILPIGLLLLTEKKKRILNNFLFVIFGILIILAALNYFGINAVISNVLILREKALLVYPFEPLKVFDYLKKDILLLGLILVNIFYALLRWRKDLIFTSLFLWFISSLFFVFSFRPVFSHHLAFLTVSSVFFISNSLLNRVASIKRLIEAKSALFLVIMLAISINNISKLSKRQNSRSIKERETMRNFILNSTKEDDTIVTDEAALYGMTGRLPPPQLVDTSYVQIKSGNLSSEKIQALINRYKPKLIIAWNGRLRELKDFENLIDGYEQVYISDNKSIFIPEE